MSLPDWLPQWVRLAGLLVVAVGLALRLKPTLVVVAAALLTGILAGIPLLSTAAKGVPAREGLINMLGRAFAENRLMTLFIITLPAIGLSERFGLQARAAALIRRVRAATVGRLLTLYQLFRVLMGIAGLRVGGHPTFVRPLIYPMALGAAEGEAARAVEVIEKPDPEPVKAAAAAAENYGNFYGQNLNPVQPGILLVYSVMANLGYSVSVWRLVLFSIPIASFSVLLGAIQFHLTGKWLRRRVARRGSE